MRVPAWLRTGEGSLPGLSPSCSVFMLCREIGLQSIPLHIRILISSWASLSRSHECMLLLCLTLCSVYGLQPTGLFCPWDSSGKVIGVSCHALLQQIFPTQGLNPCLVCLLYWGRFFTTSTTWKSHLNLFTYQRPHFLVPSPWGIGFQHMNIGSVS